MCALVRSEALTSGLSVRRRDGNVHFRSSSALQLSATRPHYSCITTFPPRSASRCICGRERDIRGVVGKRRVSLRSFRIAQQFKAILPLKTSHAAYILHACMPHAQRDNARDATGHPRPSPRPRGKPMPIHACVPLSPVTGGCLFIIIIIYSINK